MTLYCGFNRDLLSLYYELYTADGNRLGYVLLEEFR